MPARNIPTQININAFKTRFTCALRILGRERNQRGGGKLRHRSGYHLPGLHHARGTNQQDGKKLYRNT